MVDDEDSFAGDVRSGMQTDLVVRNEEVVFRGDDDAEFTVIRSQIESDGRTTPVMFAQVRGGQPSVVCVTVRADGRLLLVRHRRIATDSDEWEFPKSMGEDGQIAGDTAEHEVLRETGIRPLSHRTMQMIHAETCKLRDSVAVVEVKVENDRADAAALNDSRLQWLDRGEFDAMVRAGNISDGVTLSAYLIWSLRTDD